MASANFYNNWAVMFGVDLHHFQALPTGITELATGHRVEDWPYAVGAPHWWVGGDAGKRTPMLTADGEKMIRDGFVIHQVPHQFFPGPFHPYEAVEQGKIVMASQSTPLVKIESVTSAGDPLSVCAIFAVGANINCHDDGMKVSGVVISLCSVKTHPQLRDLIFRIFDDWLKKHLIKFLGKLFDIFLRSRKIPWPVRPILVWLFEKIASPIVDGLEALTKWLWERLETKPNERRKEEREDEKEWREKHPDYPEALPVPPKWLRS